MRRLVLPLFALALVAAAPANRFPQPVPAGQLAGRSVLAPLESQPVLGTLRQVVRLPDGTVAAVIDHGGLLGFGTRPVAVKLADLAVMGEYVVAVGVTAAELDALPAWTGAGTTPVAAGEILQVGLAKPSH